ncbi:unnamed protein product [Calicophoron daubneyi]|uniref:Uncharacterized protein n=1 Tax=Calicophoron daubneyi TaxID=300641 RepID=A0AAV2TX56_CALDB
MVRITPELIENAPQYTNAIKDRELDLRGYKFPAIENLGGTLDQFDTIDFSDNEFRKLDGFPLLKRLKNLILTNNKIVRIAEDLGGQLPNLNTIILTGNSFTELRELDPLSSCGRLVFLSLVHCPVTMRANYRLYVISRVPSLRFLDYRRITNAERRLARNMFKRLPALSTTTSNSAKNSGGQKMTNGVRASNPVKTFVPGAPINNSPAASRPPADRDVELKENAQPGTRPETSTEVVMPPPTVAPVHAGGKRTSTGGSTQDLFAIQEAIKRARTMDEVERLHQLLSSGQFAGFAAQWQQQLRQQQVQQQQQRQQQQQQLLQPQPTSQVQSEEQMADETATSEPVDEEEPPAENEQEEHQPQPQQPVEQSAA